jgi:DNA-binding CsgD family transcriptional regulator
MTTAPNPSDGLTERAARLSEGQRQCLRLVRRHKTSKEIARELGISKATVDQRLRIAGEKLGVVTRTEAALLLEAVEGAIYDRVSYAPVDIEPDHLQRSTSPRLEDAGIGAKTELAEAQAPYWGASPANGLGTIPLPIRRGKQNTLTPAQRLLWIALIMLGLAMFGVVMLAALETLGRLTTASS